MSERRRLKAGVEVEVDGDSVWLHVGPGAVIAFTLPKKYGGADLITEPIPEEPAGPKVGDEVTAEWLRDEWLAGRHHVVRNPDGSAASWQCEVEGTRCVEDADGRYAKKDSEATWPLLALHPVKRWGLSDTTEPPLDVRMDCAEEFASDLERTLTVLEVRLNAMEDRIEALEKDSHPPVRIPLGEIEARIEVQEVMPDAGGSIADDDSTRDVAPPPGAEQDAPGGDEPSVEEVLEWLEDIESAFAASVTDAKMPMTAARIIRELGEEIEEWSNLYRRTRGTLMLRDNEMAELRDQVASLTERLTITDEKVKAAFAEQGRHHIRDNPAMVCILTAAGMIDPEVEG